MIQLKILRKLKVKSLSLSTLSLSLPRSPCSPCARAATRARTPVLPRRCHAAASLRLLPLRCCLAAPRHHHPTRARTPPSLLRPRTPRSATAASGQAPLAPRPAPTRRLQELPGLPCGTKASHSSLPFPLVLFPHAELPARATEPHRGHHCCAELELAAELALHAEPPSGLAPTYYDHPDTFVAFHSISPSRHSAAPATALAGTRAPPPVPAMAAAPPR